MDGLYELHRQPELDSPVLVLGMEGWIDAGLGGGGAMGHLLDAIPTEVLATFDGDQLLDLRSRRPAVRITDGVLSGLTWPEIQLRSGRDPAGKDVVILTGPEPDMRWQAFVSAVVTLATGLNARLVVGLGAFPAPVPHTRPVQLAAVATDQELAEQVGFMPGSLEVPAGIHAALQEGLGAAGIPAVGVWARVPHYVAAMPYPAASAALVESLAAVAGLDLDAKDLHDAAALARSRIDDIIAASEEHAEMVRQLEASADAEVNVAPINLSQLPTGDELADELERFLRGEM
ncbi:MAG: PAC2 family protein [Actinomycetota bacterium]|nr:PAC2 family protein [Actinomycetota bacterium]